MIAYELIKDKIVDYFWNHFIADKKKVQISIVKNDYYPFK
jgi:hypothetical protein